jgi:hypothetical protein
MAATLQRLLQPEEFIYSLHDVGKKSNTTLHLISSTLPVATEQDFICFAVY